MSLPFYLFDVNGGESFPAIRVMKSRSVFEIKAPNSDGEAETLDFYMKSNQALRVKFEFSGGEYSAEGEGTVVVHASQALGEAIAAVDAIVKEYFIETYAKTRSTFGNVVWTEEAIHEMFRPSLWESAFRCKITKDKTDFFDSRGRKLNYYIGCNRVQRGTNISIVVCPAFAWCRNRKIGITWDARQVMCEVPGTAAAVYDSEIPDIDDDVDYETVETTNSTSWSLSEQVTANTSWSLTELSNDAEPLHEVTNISWSLTSMIEEDHKQDEVMTSWSIASQIEGNETKDEVATSWSIRSKIEDDHKKNEVTTSWSIASQCDEDEPIAKTSNLESSSQSWSLRDTIVDETIPMESKKLVKKKKVIVRKK